MVVDAEIEQRVARGAVLVLLARAKLRGGDISARIHGGDVDLVARVLEVEELWRDFGDGVVLVRDKREGRAQLHVRREGEIASVPS